ncbi:Glycosyltransferase involved in cell wall bisynthesis [Raineyella antarctica]|uniref:Glycosyltransferase involved in cell wall bisynthesis n=1 Tax=Raineyella antarctica TaxID=1577474 RepID=A0A1G6GDQ2_9ACTN|nr:glycosyltransferase family 4 protein [Raineyella antarctica]SDB79865.1 Glycosyltransferase involved in cell wall bisynthesis [Raineyella antarctica]
MTRANVRRPLRIVHAISSDAFAGVERHVSTLAAAQSRMDSHRVAVIGGDPGAMRATIGDPSVVVHPAGSVLDVVRGLDRLRDCDVIHVHMTAAETAAVLSLRSWRVPVVATRHFAAHRGRSLGGRSVAPLIRARVSAQISISAYVADRIDGPSTVVHPGVPSQPDPVAGIVRTPSVLVVQRLEAEKDTADAIRAFASSGLHRHGWSLDIAGSGSQVTALSAVARELGVSDRVRFLGHRSDVVDLMRQAGLLVAPCSVEGLGLTVLEAMAAGLPVVASAAGGHLETVGAVREPALFSPHDVVAAGELMSELAADPSRRACYGAELRDLQRTSFTTEAQARATDLVYRSVL